eukprot:2550674-Rhodomonas_salina.1
MRRTTAAHSLPTCAKAPLVATLHRHDPHQYRTPRSGCAGPPQCSSGSVSLSSRKASGCVAKSKTSAPLPRDKLKLQIAAAAAPPLPLPLRPHAGGAPAP